MEPVVDLISDEHEVLRHPSPRHVTAELSKLCESCVIVNFRADVRTTFQKVSSSKSKLRSRGNDRTSLWNPKLLCVTDTRTDNCRGCSSKSKQNSLNLWRLTGWVPNRLKSDHYISCSFLGFGRAFGAFSGAFNSAQRGTLAAARLLECESKEASDNQVCSLKAQLTLLTTEWDSSMTQWEWRAQRLLNEPRCVHIISQTKAGRE